MAGPLVCPGRLTTDIQHGHAAPVQRVHLFPGPLLQLRHKLGHASLNQRLHLLQYGRGEDVRDALPPLAVLLGLLHLEDALPAKVVIRRGLDAGAAAAIDGPDARQRAERELVGCQSHDRTVFPMQGVDGATAVPREVDEKDPLGREAGDERARNGRRDR